MYILQNIKLVINETSPMVNIIKKKIINAES